MAEHVPVRAYSAYVGTGKPGPADVPPRPRRSRRGPRPNGVRRRRQLHELQGAKRLGMTTVWVDNGDRQSIHVRFDPTADFTVRELAELPPLIDRLRRDDAGRRPPA